MSTTENDVASDESSAIGWSVLRSDLELISSEVSDPAEQEKLREFLLLREEIESDPNFLNVVDSLPPDEEWVGHLFAIPIIWLTRPRRKAQFLSAVKIMRFKYSDLETPPT